MKRIRHTLVLLLALLPALAISSLWIRSYYVEDYIYWFGNPQPAVSDFEAWRKSFDISSKWGDFKYGTLTSNSDGKTTVEPSFHPTYKQFNATDNSTDSYLWDGTPAIPRYFGIAWNYHDTSCGWTGTHDLYLTIHYHLLLLFSLLPLAVLTIKHLSRRSRKRLNLCPHCGYDLRATPTRCPECGSPTDH